MLLTMLCVAWIVIGKVSLASEEPAGYALHRDVVYAAPDGLDLTADIYVPAGPGPFAAVLVLHSGSWARGNKSRMDDVAGELARSGFVVMNANYRLVPDAQFPAPLHDCRAAVRFLRENAAPYGVDRERIAAVGYSAGGHLALMLALSESEEETESGQPSSRLQAVATAGAPTDLLGLPDVSSIRNFVGADRESTPEDYRRASPIYFASADDPPVLLVHGQYDIIVPVEQSVRMAAALQASGVPVERRELPRGHVRTTTGFNAEQVALIVSFLRRTLPEQTTVAAP